MLSNPYTILGVSIDATVKQISAAYRTKAKQAHPDGGGSPEQFARLKHASSILLNPMKRERFDKCGIMDEDKPDNIMASAMERIASFFVNSINAMETAPHLEKLNLVQSANQFFDENTAGCHQQIAMVERQITRFNKTLGRLKTARKDDVVKVIINNHIAALRSNILANKRQIEVLTTSKSILKDYTFEQDAATNTANVKNLFWGFPS